ncbi:signal-regulatory protein beta-2 [Maylandia zebra]|uniref:signal-regulatory protein beta-2 n=1 Tax=Maylandia zebra TaxID=106582 RepID=UPI00403D1EBA
MVILWITLLFLHRGNSLVPVKTVHVGETATLTCVLPNEELGSRKVQWYKQRVGDTLKLLVSLPGKPSSEFFQSRFSAHNSKDFSNLTIWNVAQEDEGMYHCGIDTWIKLEWSGTYLLVKGNTERTSNYIVVQQPTESNPLRPGDTATLQCSVLTNSENNTCSGHHNVFWFRDGSNKSLPNIIYTHGNRADQCEKRSDPQDGCVYRFSKNVGSSDAGTYYCAVATCGEILFGNGTTLDVQGICA